MKISVVVPCFNEEASLPAFKARFDEITARAKGVAFELLFVDDGSKDQTLSICKRFAADDPRVKVISFSRNFGKEAALLCGLKASGGDLVSMMDADLQDPPELILSMLDKMEKTSCDCVAARRVTRAGEPPVRSFFARMFYRLTRKVSEVRVEDGVRDFRLMKRDVAEAIVSLPEKRRFSKGLMVWVGFDTRYIEYENIERFAGETKFSFSGLFRYAIEGIASLTNAPLSMPFVFAAFCVCGTILFAVAGFLTGAVVCAISSFILCGLGVMGSFIGRVFSETRKRPLYVKRK